MSFASNDASTLPTKTKATKQYIVVIRNSEIIIVKGRFFAGFFISPATAAIFVTPAYEIYKNADSTRATRGFFRFGVEKRHTDEWHYASVGSFVTASTVVTDRVKIFLHGGANFTHRGYALYKLTV